MIGIGGVSMSGIAEILKNWGFHVSGSDLNSSDVIDKVILQKIRNKFSDISLEQTKSILKEIKKNCQYQEYGARKIDKLLEQIDLNTVYK